VQPTGGLGWPLQLPPAGDALGWPTIDIAGERAAVSRETALNEDAPSDPEDAVSAPSPTRADSTADSGQANQPCDVSRETEAAEPTAEEPSTQEPWVERIPPVEVARTGDATAAEDALAAVVSRVTDDRDEVASSLPNGDRDTPLAQAVAADARKRIALTGRVFPKPATTRVLTVANQKGGVGKTTTTVNVAAALAQAGLTVLVIDIDPQGNASTALGIDHHAEVPSIYDVLVEGTPLADVVQECPEIPGLWCAPATIDLAGAEIELVSLVARETRLQKAIAAYLAQTEVTDPSTPNTMTPDTTTPDYVLIDCPPSLGLLTVNAFVAAQEVFIPIQCEYYALEGLSQLLKNIELIRNHLNPTLHVSTILLTMYDGRTRLSAQVADEVRNHFPDQVLRNTVPRSVRISEAPSHGQTVITYDPNSSGALSYLGAAAELADRGAATAQDTTTSSTTTHEEEKTP
jgi:chromosome partitioning protein